MWTPAATAGKRWISNNERPRVLVTGALGQIGTDLTKLLRTKYGAENVIASDIRKPHGDLKTSGPFMYCDVLNRAQMESIIVENDITWIVHLSAIMSVLGEQIPQKALDLNVDAVRNVLELARTHNLRTFIPSTMAVFNKDAGQIMTKDDCILNPTTVYGITKVFLEHLGGWYNRKYGVDFRSLRYPGILAAETLPGGGTTDYAVHMYHYALKGKEYTCPVLPGEALPMMYMPDCLKCTERILEADASKLTRRVYNIAAISFTPAEVEASIKKFIPGFKVRYERGLAQSIAETWPKSMDDSNARRDWGWNPEWDLDRMTKDMLEKIPQLHNLKE